jgi:hypothetical protein
MEQKFVVTQTFRQTDVRALLDSGITNTLSVQILYPQTNTSPYIFVRNISPVIVSSQTV